MDNLKEVSLINGFLMENFEKNGTTIAEVREKV